MSGQGPATLFVYYQKPYRMNDQGEVEEQRQPHEFFVTHGKYFSDLTTNFAILVVARQFWMILRSGVSLNLNREGVVKIDQI